jgi:hypothetical protein
VKEVAALGPTVVEMVEQDMQEGVNEPLASEQDILVRLILEICV